jgi:hypothetical protein
MPGAAMPGIRQQPLLPGRYLVQPEMDPSGSRLSGLLRATKVSCSFKVRGEPAAARLCGGKGNATNDKINGGVRTHCDGCKTARWYTPGW